MICGQREVRVFDESKRDERKTETRVGRSGEPPAAGDVVLGSPCGDPPPSSRPRRSPYWFSSLEAPPRWFCWCFSFCIHVVVGALLVIK